MPLHAEGIAILVSLIVTVIILSLIGVYCHFCAEVNSGGMHHYRSDENLTRVKYVGKTSNGTGPKRNKCKCSNKFKGSCKKCEGEDFVDDGQDEDRQNPDWSGHGGDKGLDPDWGNKPDPIRSALGGNNSSGNNTGGGDNYGDQSSGMMMRDD